MRVLMLGWDFSPRLSGGVGSACQGLASALARMGAPLGSEVVFVLPRLRGDEEPDKVRLLSGDQAGNVRSHAAHAAAPAALAAARSVSASTAAAPRAEARLVTQAAAPAATAREVAAPAAQLAPTLAAPSEALRLLAIDSPLRPYLSPADYAGAVAALLARIHRPTPPARPASPARAPAPPSRVPGASPRALPSVPPAVPPALAEAPVSIPHYGRTLSGEVERYARAVLALVQDERFDVIHAHDWMTFPAGMLLRERLGKPLVVHFHSSESERRARAPAPEARAIEQAALDAAERVLCVSEASARALRAHYGVEYAKLRVLHNAYAPLPESARPAPGKGPVVLYLGRLSEQKSPDVFLRAAVAVVGRHPEARFVLAGEGELYPELVALAEELGLTRNVEFTGFLAGEELARAYAGADVYVLSSSAEPFGISALEALSLGVPTIVPRSAGVTEVVRSVLRFEPGDVGELADKIVALLERPALRAQLTAAGLREVKKLRWDRPARALHGIYDEIVRAEA